MGRRSLASEVRWDHLRTLGGRRGLFEHARYSTPRLEHGYCLDDNGRALVIACRAVSCGLEMPTGLRNRCLEYVLEARDRHMWRNRLSVDGVWEHGASDDAVGRGLWGLGAASAWWPEAEGRNRAGRRLLASLDFTSSWWHPLAYATLGLASAYASRPLPRLKDAIARMSGSLPRPRRATPDWMWPEPRLRYDNARLPEALIASGAALDDPALLDDGLVLLDWLIRTEVGERGFSFTPAGGRGPGDDQPAFDQQPLEAWAMADAAVRAAEVTGDPLWLPAAEAAVGWFLGDNDRRLVMYDAESGACFDGLRESGVNRNQGAESTLAALGAVLALSKPRGAP